MTRRMVAILTIVGLALGVFLKALELAGQWDQVERFSEWAWPVWVTIAMGIVIVALAGIVVWDRRPISSRQPATRRWDERAVDDERQKINLIHSEVARNRRMVEKGIGQSQITDTTHSEKWNAHQNSLAAIPGSDDAFGLVQHAYDGFQDYDAVVRRRDGITDDELREIARVAKRAEDSLEALRKSLRR